jgi:hypothetical protein
MGKYYQCAAVGIIADLCINSFSNKTKYRNFWATEPPIKPTILNGAA